MDAPTAVDHHHNLGVVANADTAGDVFQEPELPRQNKESSHGANKIIPV